MNKKTERSEVDKKNKKLNKKNKNKGKKTKFNPQKEIIMTKRSIKQFNNLKKYK